jgi:D-3-phosphoglycerate dehydrogenase
MYSIKTMNKIAQVGLKKLDPAKYTISDNEENPEGILVRSAKLHDMEFGSNLLCIARAGAGVNNIPVDRCTENGIVVFNTPGANAEAVKELALCALLIASRDVIGGIEWVKTIADEGDQVAPMVEKGKSKFVGPELKGKGLGVIGLGAIGAKIANAATHLGMKVYGYDPYLSVDAAWHLNSNVIHATEMDEIYANCDYITLHVPCIASTRGFINAETIAKMKDGVRIINLARGELVNDDDLIAALESGKVAKYVTDFPNGKTAKAPNTIAMPHLGASTPESEDNCAIMAAREARDYIENGNIKNSVNMPSAVMPRNGDPRLCVIHQNIPNVLAKITELISTQGVNIENMVNAGNKGMKNAYTIIDMNETPEGILDAVASINGVIRVRLV